MFGSALIMNNIPTIPKILIVGHSFISRLAQDIQRDPILDVNFNLKQCEIRCFGVSGASLEILEKHNGLIEFMKQYKPSIVILQIGGNDICRPDLRPETLSCHIVDFMNSLMVQQQTVCQVFVCEIFVRNKPRYITPEQYEEKRLIVNNMLKVFLSDSCKIHFWKHLRLMNSPLRIFGNDGVHLTMQGTRKFYRSLRLAVLHALDLLQ